MIFSKTTLTASPSHKVKGLVSPAWDAQRKGTSDADTGEHTEAGRSSHRAPDTSHHLQLCSEGCLRDRRLKRLQNLGQTIRLSLLREHSVAGTGWAPPRTWKDAVWGLNSVYRSSEFWCSPEYWSFRAKHHPWDKEALGNNAEVYMKNYDRWQEEKAAGPQTVF